MLHKINIVQFLQI